MAAAQGRAALLWGASYGAVVCRCVIVLIVLIALIIVLMEWWPLCGGGNILG